MHPTLHVFGAELRSSTVCVQTAIVSFFVFGSWWAARREQMHPGRTLLVCLCLGVVGLAGARLHFLINYPDFYGSRLAALNIFWGGYHIGGGVLLVAFALPFVARRIGVSAGRLADGITPATGVAIAIMRLGCFLEGCCFGLRCTYGWCLAFPKGSDAQAIHAMLHYIPPDAPYSLPVHPLQLYFLGWGLLVTVVALLLRPFRRYEGQVALVGLLVWSIGQAFLETYRSDHGPRPYWGPLPQLEWTALAMTAGALVALVVAELAHRAPQPAAEAAT